MTDRSSARPQLLGLGAALLIAFGGLATVWHVTQASDLEAPLPVAVSTPDTREAALDEAPVGESADSGMATGAIDPQSEAFRTRYMQRLKQQFAEHSGMSVNEYVDGLQARLAADARIPLPEPTLDPLPASDSAPVPLHPTYTQNVAGIINQNCINCHRTGGPAGPNARPLGDYKSLRRHAIDVARTTANGTMPPWGAAPGWGTFMGDRHLSPVAIQTLQNWVHDGCPKGPGQAPAPPHMTSVWTQGPPDVVLTVPPFNVPPSGPGWYHSWVIPMPFAEDAAIANVDVDPGEHGIVHHAQFYLDTQGRGLKLCHGHPEKGYSARYYFGPGFRPSGGLGGWAPGNLPVKPAEGAYFRVAAHSDLVVAFHYLPDGRPEVAQPRIGLYFCKNPQKQMKNIVFVSGPLNIPAGNGHYLVRDHFIVPVDSTVYMVKPHAHQVCTDIKVVATLPDGTVKPLVWVPHWDWGIQQAYRLKTPMHLPHGTRVDFQWVMDNSSKNPHNPSKPPRDVHYGEDDTDEMTLYSMAMSTDRPEDMRELERVRTLRNYSPLLDPKWTLNAATPTSVNAQSW